jgi:mono/diheme cytochrome c family protein
MKKILLAFTIIAITIASCSKKSAPTANLPNGADIFSSNCARCHGAEGVKDSRTPNLQTIALDKAGLINSITKGKGHMPAFEDKLSTAEIAAVADLIVGWHNK